MQRFCPICGTRLICREEAGEVFIICPRCGHLLRRQVKGVGERPPTAKDFEKALLQIFRKAKEAGRAYVDVRAGDLHRMVGGYPSRNHRMPVCCEVMYRLMRAGDIVLEAPPSGYGANLVIRYYLSGRDP